MLQITNLSKSYGPLIVLSAVSFVINPAERVGLIGPNGAGKTTLLRCIIGQEAPDSGSVALAPGTTLGYLAQTFGALAGQSVQQALDNAQAAYTAATAELDAAAAALADPGDYDAAMERYDAALTSFELLGGYERAYRASEVLERLGLGALDPAASAEQLSGGQKTRLALVALLLQEPNLLLLDEPTNHLDVAALSWLEGFVRDYPGAVLVVSHDRAFLDATVQRTLYLDPASHTTRSYVGGYSAFFAAREHEAALRAEAYQKQQEYVGRVSADINALKGQALGVESSSTPADRDAKFALSAKGGSKKVAAKAKSRERKLERYLESDDRVDKPKIGWGLKLDFGSPPPGGRMVMQVERLSFGYFADRPILHDLSFELFHRERVAISGPNGTGKTTLLRLLDGRLTPTAGSIRRGAGVVAGMLSQEQELLDPTISVLETIQRARPMTETEARTLLHQFLFGGESVFRLVRQCSPGERARLGLAVLTLGGCNLLLLDEPLNHLDIDAREHFQAALESFDGAVVVVSHDRAFVESYAQRTIALG